jgi:microcystin-dependent protein
MTLNQLVDNDDLDAAVPSGIIVMFSGPITDIPAEWTLCDGTNGTPDLQNKFVVGAGDEYAVGNTGGSETVQLTISELPSHTHGLKHSENLAEAEQGADRDVYEGAFSEATNPTGGDQPHENRPPFFAVAYIQKL